MKGMDRSLPPRPLVFTREALPRRRQMPLSPCLILLWHALCGFRDCARIDSSSVRTKERYVRRMSSTMISGKSRNDSSFSHALGARSPNHEAK